MKTLEIACPACGAHYRLPMPSSAVVCECTACQHEFYLDEQGKTQEIEQALAPQSLDAEGQEAVSVPEVADFDLASADLAMAGEDSQSSSPIIEDVADAEAKVDDNIEPIVPAKELAVDEDAVAREVKETLAAEHIAPPKRKRHRIWPWLVMLILILMGAGLWVQKDAWVHHPLVRSVLLKTGLTTLANDSDWLVDNRSITLRWEDARGVSKSVLVIEGTIHNRLRVALPLPRFEALLPDQLEQPHPLYSVNPDYFQQALESGGEMKSEWFDHREVAADEKRHFIVLLHGLSSKRPQRVGIRAVPGAH